MDKIGHLTMAESELLEALFIINVSVYIAQWLCLHARMSDQCARERACNE